MLSGNQIMGKASYTIGIDLGTTNSVVAYSKNEPSGDSKIHIFKILQLTGPGVVEEKESLPSFLYVKEGHEVSEKSLELPWISSQKSISVGEFARERGAEVPAKLISSSKSWLCNAYVDRESPILPWESSAAITKISPVQASCAILNHIRDAWNYEMAQGDPELNLENQNLFLTVPASFDAVARQLTVRAAQMAGLPDIILIEEPQAAFYSWIYTSDDRWREKVTKGDLVLVCDIGGGTSDFSLIEVQEASDGSLGLERLLVGDHLLVGGDNIDLSLSYFLMSKLKQEGKKLDSWQMRGLVHSCRKAKETLFSAQTIGSYPVTILGRGSGLIKGTLKTHLDYTDIEAVVLNGFFPECSLKDSPKASSPSGMKEFGLPYESDPGITRHLARFVSSHKNEEGDVRLPTAVVFNGGVMKSDVLRKRVLNLLSSWRASLGQGVVRELDSTDFDFSVARGAAYYGLASQGEGIRIRSGLGNSYYMAVEASMPAVPGIVLPTRALCIAPFGMEEGSAAACSHRLFNLVVGEMVTFTIMASSIRHEDGVGDVVDDWEEKGIRELASIETFLEGEERVMIPVTFEVKVTEIGTLEFWACSRDDSRKWKLELNVRPKDE